MRHPSGSLSYEFSNNNNNTNTNINNINNNVININNNSTNNINNINNNKTTNINNTCLSISMKDGWIELPSKSHGSSFHVNESSLIELQSCVTTPGKLEKHTRMKVVSVDGNDYDYDYGMYLAESNLKQIYNIIQIRYV